MDKRLIKKHIYKWKIIEEHFIKSLKRKYGKENVWNIKYLSLQNFLHKGKYPLFKLLPYLIRKNPLSIDVCVNENNSISFYEIKSGKSRLSFKQILFIRKLVKLGYNCFLYHQFNLESKGKLIHINDLIYDKQPNCKIWSQIYPNQPCIEHKMIGNEIDHDIAFEEGSIERYKDRIKQYKENLRYGLKQLKNLQKIKLIDPKAKRESYEEYLLFGRKLTQEDLEW